MVYGFDFVRYQGSTSSFSIRCLIELKGLCSHIEPRLQIFLYQSLTVFRILDRKSETSFKSLAHHSVFMLAP